MAVFTIVKCGVYAHAVPGVWSTPEQAIDKACELAKNDSEAPWGSTKDRPDGYHDWQVWDNTVDGESALRCTIGWVNRGHYRGLKREVWVPPSMLSMWIGERNNRKPPELYLGELGEEHDPNGPIPYTFIELGEL